MNSIEEQTRVVVDAMREELQVKEQLHAARHNIDMLETKVASATKNVLTAKRALDQVLQAVARGDV